MGLIKTFGASFFLCNEYTDYLVAQQVQNEFDGLALQLSPAKESERAWFGNFLSDWCISLPPKNKLRLLGTHPATGVLEILRGFPVNRLTPVS